MIPESSPLVLSARYRGYDAPHTLPAGTIVYDETLRQNVNLSGRYVAKAVKCAPQLLGHWQRDIIWVDGSMEWTGHDLGALVEQVPNGGVGIYRHHLRDCIYDEALASIDMGPRYAGEPIAQQVAHYRESGHRANSGLWETGLVVWRGAQWTLGVRWLAEMLAWSSQDQISLPFTLSRVVEQRGNETLHVTDLTPGNAWENPWMVCRGHAA